jgi:curved DNA-binding protein
MGSLDDLFTDLGGAELADNGRAAGRTTTRKARRTVPRFEAEAEITLAEVETGTKRLIEIDGRRIEVTLPVGVEDGQRIRFSGVGTDGSDVFLRVKVKRHPKFVRRGADLETELSLTLAEALLGAEVPVETLSGRVLLRIPPETQNGRTFRLAGKGLPRFRGEGRGDLYVKVRVVLPAGLDEQGRDLAGRFLEHVRQPDPRRKKTVESRQ